MHAHTASHALHGIREVSSVEEADSLHGFVSALWFQQTISPCHFTSCPTPDGSLSIAISVAKKSYNCQYSVLKCVWLHRDDYIYAHFPLCTSYIPNTNVSTMYVEHVPIYTDSST